MLPKINQNLSPAQKHLLKIVHFIRFCIKRCISFGIFMVLVPRFFSKIRIVPKQGNILLINLQ